MHEVPRPQEPDITTRTTQLSLQLSRRCISELTHIAALDQTSVHEQLNTALRAYLDQDESIDRTFQLRSAALEEPDCTIVLTLPHEQVNNLHASAEEYQNMPADHVRTAIRYYLVWRMNQESS